MPSLPRHCRNSQSIAQQKRAGASMQPCRTPEEVWNGKENQLAYEPLWQAELTYIRFFSDIQKIILDIRKRICDI